MNSCRHTSPSLPLPRGHCSPLALSPSPCSPNVSIAPSCSAWIQLPPEHQTSSLLSLRAGVGSTPDPRLLQPVLGHRNRNLQGLFFFIFQHRHKGLEHIPAPTPAPRSVPLLVAAEPRSQPHAAPSRPFPFGQCNHFIAKLQNSFVQIPLLPCAEGPSLPGDGREPWGATARRRGCRRHPRCRRSPRAEPGRYSWHPSGPPPVPRSASASGG